MLDPRMVRCTDLSTSLTGSVIMMAPSLLRSGDRDAQPERRCVITVGRIIAHATVAARRANRGVECAASDDATAEDVAPDRR